MNILLTDSYTHLHFDSDERFRQKEEDYSVSERVKKTLAF